MLKEIGQRSREEGEAVKGLTLTGETFTALDLEELEFEDVHFSHCRFVACSFADCSFYRTVWESCDFSNCSFAGSYWKGCTLQDSKGEGCDLRESVWKLTALRHCRMRMVNADQSAWEGCTWEGCDWRSSFFTQCKLKKLTARETDLAGVSFFRTPLAALDFSDCHIEGLTIGQSHSELQGLTIGAHQAQELVKLLGIRVK